jgi:quercetin dioxygenase-like cupin family protein
MEVSRRELLSGAAGALVATAAAGLGASVAGAGTGAPEPVRGNDGAPFLGPRNEPVERQNPDLVSPPATDSGTVPNLKFSFDTAHTRITTGGWAREVTVRELPVATQIAAVNMRLKPGAIRELHWHKPAEWAFMLSGRARVTAIDPEGRTYISDVGESDIWNFPSGIPHSIQALAGGCEFLLVFDDGSFSENETFLLTDWFAHTPPAVLAKNFGVPESAFANIPTNVEQTRYIFDSAVPGSIAKEEVDLQPRALRAEADRGRRRRGADRRLEELPACVDDCGCARRPGARRDARAALPSDDRRVAVLRLGPCPHDRLRLQRDRAHVRLPGG